jgi:hypothetical protein
MAWRIRRLVNTGIYQRVLARSSTEQQHTFSRLLERDGTSPFTAFDRIKEAPKSATLTHLDEWLSRLLEGVRPAKITHLAQEAASLYPSDLLDFSEAKRFTLLACLIFQATVSTHDEIVQMFLKRIARLTEKAKQELERLRKEERVITEHLVEVLADVVQASADAKDAADRPTRCATRWGEPMKWPCEAA